MTGRLMLRQSHRHAVKITIDHNYDGQRQSENLAMRQIDRNIKRDSLKPGQQDRETETQENKDTGK